MEDFGRFRDSGRYKANREWILNILKTGLCWDQSQTVVMEETRFDGLKTVLKQEDVV
jgi:hypothetical protein